MSSAASSIDFGGRTALAVTLLNENRFAECERELAAIMGYPELPQYYRIKCHILLAECQEDWYAAEREFQIAENMWWNCRYRWPAETANPSTNWLLDKLRNMLDSLRAALEEERPLESQNYEEQMEEDMAELAEGDQEMFAQVAESEQSEPEAGQDEEESERALE